MAHARERRGGDRGRQRRGEDEAAGVAAHAVDHGGRPGDEATQRPVALGQAALHDRDVGRCTQELRHAGALMSVRPRSVRLVEGGQRAVLDGERADLAQRRDVAVHGVDGLERDDARAVWGAARRAARAGGRDRCGGRWRARLGKRGMPSIIDAWLRSSERITQRSSRPPSALRLASFAMNPDVNTSAASWPCRSASSSSNSRTSTWEPPMLRVPPEPTPCSASAKEAASTTAGCRLMQR